MPRAGSHILKQLLSHQWFTLSKLLPITQLSHSFHNYHQLSSSQDYSLTRSISERTVLLQSSFVPGAFWWSAELRRHCWEIQRGKHHVEESQASSGAPVGTQSSWSKTKAMGGLNCLNVLGWAGPGSCPGQHGTRPPKATLQTQWHYEPTWLDVLLTWTSLQELDKPMTCQINSL